MPDITTFKPGIRIISYIDPVEDRKYAYYSNKLTALLDYYNQISQLRNELLPLEQIAESSDIKGNYADCFYTADQLFQTDLQKHCTSYDTFLNELALCIQTVRRLSAHYMVSRHKQREEYITNE